MGGGVIQKRDVRVSVSVYVYIYVCVCVSEKKDRSLSFLNDVKVHIPFLIGFPIRGESRA